MYYLSSTPCTIPLLREQQIKNKLHPLLNQIRHNRINSIYQLRDTLYRTQLHPNLYKLLATRADSWYVSDKVFDRRYHPLNFKRNDTPHSNKSKTSSEKHQHKDDKIGKGMLSTRIDRNVDMKMKYGNITQEIVNGSYRVVVINPASKIKSHLIREIDFEQIDAALYRKPKLKDRFAEICDEIKTRRRKSVRNKSVVESNWRTLYLENYNYGVDNSFKVTTRHKFWSKPKIVQYSHSLANVLEHVNPYTTRLGLHTCRVNLMSRKPMYVSYRMDDRAFWD